VSYTEDSYGVVQSSLSGIITVLLDTLEVCVCVSLKVKIV